MNRFEKHKKFIVEKLKGTYSVVEIQKIGKVPGEVKYITWSMGWEAETDYSYELKCNNGMGEQTVIICHLVTFLNLFILQSLFFMHNGIKYERIYPNK